MWDGVEGGPKCRVKCNGKVGSWNLCCASPCLNVVATQSRTPYIMFGLGSDQTSCFLQNVTATEDNGKKPYSCWGFFTGRLPQLLLISIFEGRAAAAAPVFLYCCSQCYLWLVAKTLSTKAI